MMNVEIGGRLAILMADIKKKGKLYSMLLYMNKLGTLEEIVIKNNRKSPSISAINLLKTNLLL
ncbi:hypothetical protein ACQPUQ_14075 [Clostridium paraputrificum]|jgi:hypothetical protein|uniref:hypothetical protein n=1 Tax=Clostridium paraputrificum TaxID=29363 RepID=UPI0012DC40D5|nr:hypothetical protein [Clostridium paraputrificum]